MPASDLPSLHTFTTVRQVIGWRDEFRIDQPRIDSQHESIFDLAVEASELARQRDENDTLMAVFEKFGRVLEAHFRHEEGRLTEVAYPKLEAHRAEHGAMLSECGFIRQCLSSRGEGWAL